MSELTIIDATVHRVTGTTDGDRFLVDPAAFHDALGWELKPEGLCRGDVCVPVADPGALTVGRPSRPRRAWPPPSDGRW